MEGVRNYLTSLVAVSVLTAVLQILFRDEDANAARSFACGMLVIAVAISPLSRIDLNDVAKSLSRFRLEEFSAAAGVTVNNRAIAADIIKDQAESYIWDKAAQLQFQPESVSVTVDTEGEYPYPVSAAIAGKYTQQQRIELTLWIEESLAIAQGNQKWTWK